MSHAPQGAHMIWKSLITDQSYLPPPLLPVSHTYSKALLRTAIFGCFRKLCCLFQESV